MVWPTVEERARGFHAVAQARVVASLHPFKLL